MRQLQNSLWRPKIFMNFFNISNLFDTQFEPIKLITVDTTDNNVLRKIKTILITHLIRNFNECEIDEFAKIYCKQAYESFVANEQLALRISNRNHKHLLHQTDRIFGPFSAR